MHRCNVVMLTYNSRDFKFQKIPTRRCLQLHGVRLYRVKMLGHFWYEYLREIEAIFPGHAKIFAEIFVSKVSKFIVSALLLKPAELNSAVSMTLRSSTQQCQWHREAQLSSVDTSRSSTQQCQWHREAQLYSVDDTAKINIAASMTPRNSTMQCWCHREA